MPVPKLPAEAVQVLESKYLSQFDAFLAPVDAEWLSGRVSTLLSHWFVPDMPYAVQVAMLGDWLDILGHLPQSAIAAACLQWLGGERSKPMPSDILALASERVAWASEQRTALRRLVDANKGERRNG